MRYFSISATWPNQSCISIVKYIYVYDIFVIDENSAKYAK